MLRIRSKCTQTVQPMIKDSSGQDRATQGAATEEPIDCDFDGFRWPVKGIVLPDNFLSPLKVDLYLESLHVAVEYRKNNKSAWGPADEVVREKAREGEPEERVGGPSPTTGPIPGPSVADVEGARARGIIVGSNNAQSVRLDYGPDGALTTNQCQDCGGMLSLQAAQAGKTTHRQAGESCHFHDGETGGHMKAPTRSIG